MGFLLQGSTPPTNLPVTIEGLIILLGAAAVPLVVPAGKALIGFVNAITEGRRQRMKLIEQLRKQQAEDRKFFTEQVQAAQKRADQAFALSDTTRKELEQEREKRRALEQTVAEQSEALKKAQQEATFWRERAETLEKSSADERVLAQKQLNERTDEVSKLSTELRETKDELEKVQERVRTLEKRDADKLPPAPTNPPDAPPETK